MITVEVVDATDEEITSDEEVAQPTSARPMATRRIGFSITIFSFFKLNFDCKFIEICVSCVYYMY